MIQRTLLAATLFCSLAVTPTSLSAQYVEDRDNRAPTAKYWYSNLTAASLAAQVATGKRIVDIEVTRVTPSMLFTVSMVPNVGTFKKGWWYYYNLTPTSISSLVTKNKARLTDIEPYQTTSGTRYAVLMEWNAVKGKAWWYHSATSIATIAATATKNGARVVDLEEFKVGTKNYYSAILLKNSGADAKAWWWYLNLTRASVDTLLATNKARIWDLNRLPNGRYNVVMVRFSGEYEWHFYGRTSGQVLDVLRQYGARLIDIEQYSTSFGNRYDVVFANASNTASSRARDAMRGKGSGGVMGCYLRHVPKTGLAATLAYIDGDRRFEPASALKLLHHVTTMRQVYASSSWYLSKSTSVKYKTASSSCPISTKAYNLTLQSVLQGMMQKSNNSYTRTILELWGMSGLNATASSLGMTNTKVKHHIGCGTPANYTSLVDLGKIHERVIKGYLGSQRSNFYSIMLKGFYSGAIGKMIDQEALRVGLTTKQRAAFVANMRVSSKGGNYLIGTPLKYHRAWAAYVRLPCWTTNGLTTREYAAGVFVNDATNDSKASSAIGAGAAEILRDEVNTCMKTMKSWTPGSFVSYGSSCGGKYTPYSHTATGTPELGKKVNYKLSATGRTGTTLASFELGSSNTLWGATPLPFNLTFMGAKDCYWRTNSLIKVFLNVTNGSASLNNLLIPLDKNLIGLQVYTQFLIKDDGANAANLTTTNGLRTTVGGLK